MHLGLKNPLAAAAALFLGQLAVFGVLSALCTPGVAAWVILGVLLLVNGAAAHWTGCRAELTARLGVSALPWAAVGGVLGSLPWLLAWALGAPVTATFELGWPLLGTLGVVTWEELWFRGTTLVLLESRLGKRWAAALLSVVFVVLHVLNPELDLLISAPSLFLGSACLCLLTSLTRSLWAAIAMHFVNNVLDAPGANIESNPAYLATLGLIALLLFMRQDADSKPAD